MMSSTPTMITHVRALLDEVRAPAKSPDAYFLSTWLAKTMGMTPRMLQNSTVTTMAHAMWFLGLAIPPVGDGWGGRHAGAGGATGGCDHTADGGGVTGGGGGGPDPGGGPT